MSARAIVQTRQAHQMPAASAARFTACHSSRAIASLTDAIAANGAKNTAWNGGPMKPSAALLPS